MENRAYLIGCKVVVLDVDLARQLYKEGFYGKFTYMPKVKDLSLCDKIESPLELSLIEALYLMKRGRIKIYTPENKEVPPSDFVEIARKYIELFDELYTVYEDLRNRGYVVKSGMKFGATYAVYKYGPGIDHAPFLVQVLTKNTKIDPIEIVRAGRLSHSVRKKFVIAVKDTLTQEVKYYAFKWFG
ncbi:MAG: tRNA-intron lyase [Thermoprotei archaeon]|nr:MAG: tRNA-intron lyase [Thermoprotei archaeon]RLE96966.1 MAG: tRNA-intron lyase [Thermoprotei archaeon]HDI75465.1 tRNA-intron lyase [Thermoprotei archaeon]